MSTARAKLKQSAEQRVALLAFVAALFLAPLLANTWPAFGKGPMLFTGAAVATESDHAQHAEHEGHQAPATESHHQRHCALCVLAFLGWAPPVGLSLGCVQACVADRSAWAEANAPLRQLGWRSAQARAPPLS